MQKAMLSPIVAATGLAVAHTAELQVTVHGMADDKSPLYFALFDQEGFLKKPITTAKATPQQPMAVFQNLAPGAYAVSVFQDLNDNGALDRNLVGAPTEPFGFSNDASGIMGPPRFDAASVQVTTENQSIAIKLR